MKMSEWHVVKKSVEIYMVESLLRWYGLTECIANDRLVKMIIVDCTGRTDILHKRWTDAVSESFKGRDISDEDVRGIIFDFVQAYSMVSSCTPFYCFWSYISVLLLFFSSLQVYPLCARFHQTT